MNDTPNSSLNDSFIDRSRRPVFVGPGWCNISQGLSFVEPIPNRIDRWTTIGGEQVTSEWHELVLGFDRLRAGQFSAISEILHLSGHADEDIAICATYVLGCCSTEEARDCLLQRLHADEPRLEVREAQYEAAVHALDVALIEGLLSRLSKAGVDECQTIYDAISDLLGNNESGWAYESERRRQEAFQVTVRERVRIVNDRWGPRTALFRGLPITLNDIAGRIKRALSPRRIADEIGNLMLYSEFIEAFTGTSIETLFDDDLNPRPLAFRIFLAAAESSCPVIWKAKGLRYFLGHAIPG